MVTKTQTLGTGAFIKSEANGEYSRDQIVIVSGAGALLAGTVLGKITASGKYKAYDNDNVDGTQTAVAVLLSDVDATSADVNAVAVVRAAELWTDRLQWAATVAAGEKTAAYTELAAIGIVLR